LAVNGEAREMAERDGVTPANDEVQRQFREEGYAEGEDEASCELDAGRDQPRVGDGTALAGVVDDGGEEADGDAHWYATT
jgi:hypothetical protein